MIITLEHAWNDLLRCCPQKTLSLSTSVSAPRGEASCRIGSTTKIPQLSCCMTQKVDNLKGEGEGLHGRFLTEYMPQWVGPILQWVGTSPPYIGVSHQWVDMSQPYTPLSQRVPNSELARSNPIPQWDGSSHVPTPYPSELVRPNPIPQWVGTSQSLYSSELTRPNPRNQ
jgi:hypothetical protein